MKKLMLPVVIVCICIINIVTLSQADDRVSDPGSVNDPLVSKSYVDAKFDELSELINGGIKEDKDTQQNSKLDEESVKYIEGLIDFKLDEELGKQGIAEIVELVKLSLQDEGISTENTFKYVPVGPVKAGSKIFGKAGTEVILRSGEATSICPGQSGLQNVTKGEDITNNQSIPLNHLVIIPREDGRGIQINREAWLMIRGGYQIEEQQQQEQ